MLVDELSRMTPETQNALLSAEGEKWHGDWGTPHGKSSAVGKHVKVGLGYGKFTKRQRQFVRHLRSHGRTPASVLRKAYKMTPISVARGLIRFGYVTSEKVGNTLYYDLTEKGRTCEIKKSHQEQVRALMIELSRFRTFDLEEEFSPQMVRTAIRFESENNRIKKIKHSAPYLWEWVG